MKINFKTRLGAAVIMCLVGSCAHTGTVSQHLYECTDRLARAIKKYDAGKYASTKTILDDVKQQCAGHRIMDSVEYYLAMSLVHMRMYDEAKLEFTRLTQDFPQSSFFYEAQFRIGYCVLKSALPVERDQTETRAALRLFSDFLQNYPASEFADTAQKYLKICVNKLAEKEFASAKFYQRIGEKEAAIVYYKTFINDYPASQFTSQARLNMGQMLIDLSRKAEAREVLDALIAEEKTGELIRKAQELLARCKE